MRDGEEEGLVALTLVRRSIRGQVDREDGRRRATVATESGEDYNERPRRRAGGREVPSSGVDTEYGGVIWYRYVIAPVAAGWLSIRKELLQANSTSERPGGGALWTAALEQTADEVWPSCHDPQA